MITELDLEEQMARDFGLAPHQCALCVVRSQQYKFVQFAGGGMPPLLYDMGADPAELHNLAADPQHAPTLAAMAGQMLSRMLTHADRSTSEVVVTSAGPLRRSLPLRLPLQATRTSASAAYSSCKATPADDQKEPGPGDDAVACVTRGTNTPCMSSSSSTSSFDSAGGAETLDDVGAGQSHGQSKPARGRKRSAE
jgi:hypothetical protein